MRKKRLLFCAYYLDLGGIETALINLLKRLDYNKVEVTLLLEKKEGVFLDEVPNNVKIEHYKLHEDKFVLLRKIKNRLKLIMWILKNKNRYDFAACFATYSIPGSILSRMASSNNAIWIHSNYYHVYHENKNEMKKFFLDRKIEKFKKLVFVSEESKEDFLKIFPNLKNKSLVLNNYIDDKLILKKQKEKIAFKKKNVFTLLFVGRLEERAKKLTRLIKVMEQLKNEKIICQLLVVGDGPDSDFYKEIVKDKNLEKEIIFLGKKKNPYPYFKLCDLVVLTSDYEGFPVVCLESMILNKPFLTTINLHDKYINLSDYGIIVSKEVIVIKEKIKEVINNGLPGFKKFDILKYQNKLNQDFNQLIGEDINEN